MGRAVVGGVVLAVLLSLSSCKKEAKEKEMVEETVKEEESPTDVKVEPTVAYAFLMGGENSAQSSGIAWFEEADDGKTRIRVRVDGLPAGEYAVHVHERGDCSDDNFESAGGHFNPDNKKHGAPDAEERHAGDLGNIKVEEDGLGEMELWSDKLRVKVSDYSVVNRAVIVHEKPDDFKSQPSGNAGSRIMCGVVKYTTVDEETLFPDLEEVRRVRKLSEGLSEEEMEKLDEEQLDELSRGVH